MCEGDECVKSGLTANARVRVIGVRKRVRVRRFGVIWRNPDARVCVRGELGLF